MIGQTWAKFQVPKFGIKLKCMYVCMYPYFYQPKAKADDEKASWDVGNKKTGQETRPNKWKVTMQRFVVQKITLPGQFSALRMIFLVYSVACRFLYVDLGVGMTDDDMLLELSVYLHCFSFFWLYILWLYIFIHFSWLLSGLFWSVILMMTVLDHS